MTTLEDVAKLAGVSIATVSYVINETKSVKPETKLKILAAIEQLNYIPNNSARKLRESNSKEICVVFPHIDDPYYSEILQGMIQCAEEQGYTITVAFSYNHPQKEQKIIQDFIGRNVSGIMIITCQSSNTDFFENSIIRYKIPTVFIDRMPKGLDVNFISFDNYSTVFSLTEHLLESNYEKIALFTGTEDLLGENDCISAFIDAHTTSNKQPDYQLMCTCDMTKEGSFCILMTLLKNSCVPQAIISSSETITIGLTEALALCHISIPENVLIITLGIECWHSSNYHPGTLRTSRRAFTLGREAIQLIVKNILEPVFFEKKIVMHEDPYIKDTQVIPAPPKQICPTPPRKQLKILVAQLPTIHALALVAKDFSALHDIDIVFDYSPISELFSQINTDSKSEHSTYDIYLFDVSWHTYFAQENCFMDLTDFICSKTFDTTHIIEKNLENCCYKGRYYGLPIIGGTHLLFYRKDIFENISIQRAFKEQHHLPLRPPKTWAEFNGISKFFTKSYYPDSPTTYGSALSGGLNEEMILEIMVRLWSYGGGLYDKNNRLILNSPSNVKGFQSLLDTCQYVPENPFLQHHADSFQQFAAGDLAMFVSFTEYASELKRLLQADSYTKIGYSTTPGNTPANVGWHLGVNKHTANFSTITKFFEWLCEKKTSYYMTILDGQSVMDYPYHNHELLKLYPWLATTQEGVKLSRSRIYPYKQNNASVRPNQVESVLCNVFRNIYYHKMSIQDALDLGQKELLQLFS